MPIIEAACRYCLGYGSDWHNTSMENLCSHCNGKGTCNCQSCTSDPFYVQVVKDPVAFKQDYKQRLADYELDFDQDMLDEAEQENERTHD